MNVHAPSLCKKHLLLDKEGCGHRKTGSKQKGKEILNDSCVQCKYTQNQMYQGEGQIRQERTLPEGREKGSWGKVASKKVGK